MINLNPSFKQLDNQSFELKSLTSISSNVEILNDIQKLSNIGSWSWNLVANKLEWSDMMYSMLGYEAKEIRGSFSVLLYHVHKDDKQEYQEIVSKAIADKAIYHHKYRIYSNQEGIIHVEARGRCVFNKAGNPIEMIGTVQDISTEIELEIRRKAELEEKNTLLQEVHHRVRNNMQIITSLLKMQSKQITDRELLAKYKDARLRIETMALVHNRLYETNKLSKINL
jgi:PAS domain S-box-containing protein